MCIDFVYRLGKDGVSITGATEGGGGRLEQKGIS